MARADDDARHAGLIEHPADRHRADAHAVARRHLAERRQHVLEAIPAAELVDDQPVLHERSVLERRGRDRRGPGSGLTESRRPARRSRAGRCRCARIVRRCRWPAAGRAPNTAPGARRPGYRRRRFPPGAAGRSWSGRCAGSCRRGAARRATRPRPRNPARRSPTSAAARGRGGPRRGAPSERSMPRTTSAREWVGSRSRSGTYLVCTCTGTAAPRAPRRFSHSPIRASTPV